VRPHPYLAALGFPLSAAERGIKRVRSIRLPMLLGPAE
jgi:hypothetical protein